MAISNGSPILASDLNDYFDTALSNLRNVNVFNTEQKQFIQSFTIKGFNNATAEYLRTATFFPRTDCVLRGVRLIAESSTSSINITATIPAQIIKDNVIVGGNIKNTITLTATTQGVSGIPTGALTVSDASGLYTLPVEELFTILAGDSIEIVFSSDNASIADASITLLLENKVVNK